MPGATATAVGWRRRTVPPDVCIRGSVPGDFHRDGQFMPLYGLTWIAGLLDKT